MEVTILLIKATLLFFYHPAFIIIWVVGLRTIYFTHIHGVCCMPLCVVQIHSQRIYCIQTVNGNGSKE